MKLFELKRGTWFKLLDGTNVPPASPQVMKGRIYRLNNIDGMYSHCNDMEGRVVHIFANAEIEEHQTP